MPGPAHRRNLLHALPLALAGLLGLGLAGTAAAQVREYRFDPVHTRVMLAISHAGFSQAIGTVSGSQGTVVFDPQDWSTARVDVQVPLQRLDFGDAGWNRAVLGQGLLAAARWPVARFTSTGVRVRDASHLEVDGMLELHGQRQPLTLAVTFNQLKHHPLPPFRSTAGFSATATLSRAAFGITAWKSVIGDAVDLRIEAEAVRGKGPDLDEAAPSAGTPPDAPDPATVHSTATPPPNDPPLDEPATP